jgi:hypothetical protein
MKKWAADKTERRKVADLIPYAKNSRTHSKEQVAQIAASIKEWGFTNPVLIESDGGIIAGHGRVMAAQKLKLEEVPCVVAEGWTEAQKKAYVIADNKLALNAGWDESILSSELNELMNLNFDLNLTGFNQDEITDLLINPEDEEVSENSFSYSRKIEAPIYKITGAKPKEADLYNDKKTKELTKEIQEHELPSDIEKFLIHAAERHTVFNFRAIAEYYAHAPQEIQNLMEKSALVIIDFEKAIENGFISLSEEIASQYASDHNS